MNNPGSAWEARPMELPGGKYVQPIPDDAFSDKPIVEQLEGMDIIAMPPQPSGVVRYLARQLNYFAVKIVEPCSNANASGCGFSLSNIQIGEQPPELFRPAAGDAR